VEDDPVIREATQIGLERFGYAVETYEDGLLGLQAILASVPDVVLLDVMLPSLNGATVCREIRTVSQVPVLLLSARSDHLDVVQALDAGADDYLVKPFDLEVLAARIRAVVRRCGGGTAPEPGELRDVGPLRVDERRLVVTRDGIDLRLTPTELRILLLLADEKGRVLCRRQILDRVWGATWDGETRLVDVHVQRLRKKIGEDVVETVRGFGYRLAVG
jgi:DNA-binding response OmpR family regulator